MKSLKSNAKKKYSIQRCWVFIFCVTTTTVTAMQGLDEYYGIISHACRATLIASCIRGYCVCRGNREECRYAQQHVDYLCKKVIEQHQEHNQQREWRHAHRKSF